MKLSQIDSDHTFSLSELVQNSDLIHCLYHHLKMLKYNIKCNIRHKVGQLLLTGKNIFGSIQFSIYWNMLVKIVVSKHCNLLLCIAILVYMNKMLSLSCSFHEKQYRKHG